MLRTKIYIQILIIIFPIQVIIRVRCNSWLTNFPTTYIHPRCDQQLDNSQQVKYFDAYVLAMR